MTPTVPPEPPALCTHPTFDEDGMCRACHQRVALGVPKEFAEFNARMFAAVPPEPELTRVQCGVCAWTSAAHESPAEAYLEVGAHFVNVHRYAATATPSEPAPPTHKFADCIVNDGDKPCRECAEYAIDSVGAPTISATMADALRDTFMALARADRAMLLADGSSGWHYGDFRVEVAAAIEKANDALSACDALSGAPTPAAAPPTVAPAREGEPAAGPLSPQGLATMAIRFMRSEPDLDKFVFMFAAAISVRDAERDRASRSPGRVPGEAANGSCEVCGHPQCTWYAAGHAKYDPVRSASAGQEATSSSREGKEPESPALSGLDAATVEACAKEVRALEHCAKCQYCDTFNPCPTGAALDDAEDRIRALATPPGQAKP